MGETETVLPDFRHLHERMDKNGRFLYNFGAEAAVTAIDCYNYASRMVPSKFLPQYQMMNLYLAYGDTVNAINAANAILAKDVKVSRSKAVQRIINEAESLVKDVMFHSR